MRLALQSRVLFIVVVLGFFIGGCSKKQDTVAGTTPPPDATPGASVSDEARLASLDALSSFFNSLPDVDRDADKLAVLNFFKSRPEFEATGVDPDGNNVWARYTDGRLVIYADTRTPSSVVIDPPNTDTSSLGKAYNLMPGSATAIILNSLGTAYAGANASVTALRAWCKVAGYYVAYPDDPTVYALKAMGQAGIFYWVTHGGYGTTKDGDESKSFSMWTSEPVTAAGEFRYADDLAANLVQYMYGKTNVKRAGVRDSSMHYSVTGAFIKKYVKFSPYSIVYFDAPYSARIGRGTVDDANAGFYLGWARSVNDASGSKTARYFFDKVLGVNRQPPLSPEPQRAFLVADVVSEMAKKDLDVSPPGSYLLHPFENVLQNFRLLVPSITLTSQYSNTEYFIDGDFSSTPTGGVVTMNGTPATITKWDPSGIRIKKPLGGGTLVVSTRDVKSNPVNVTEWYGTLEYVRTGRGTLKEHVKINAYFYADIHWYHTAIFSDPEYAPPYSGGRMVEWMPVSVATYDCSGEYKDADSVLQEKWSGSGVLPLLEYGASGTGFSGYATIDADGTNSQCNLLVSGMYTQYVRGAGEQQVPLDFSNAALTWKHTLTDYHILAGGIPLSGGTLTWSEFSASYPPNRKAPH